MNPVCRVALAATVAIMLAMRVTPSARSSRRASRRPRSSRPPRPPAQPPAPAAAAERAQVRGDGRRQRLEDRREAHQRAGDDDGHRPATRSSARPRRTSPSCCGPCPALNITQVSARDINVTTRGATGTLATGQLALLDGRSLYQDFFGFVMWDFLPVNLNEIKQIEVIRGPASAVWGANALYGVVNVITKSPREMQGTSAILGLGGVRRAAATRMPGRSGTSAARTRRRSTIAGRSSSRAAATRRIRSSRPTGIIPGSPGPTAARAYPAVREHRHDAAEVRRARRLRLRGRPKLSLLGRRRRHRRHHAHRHRAVRHQQRLGRWATGR